MAKRDYSHFDIFRQMEMEMQQFTEEALRGVLFHPHADVYETADALVIKVELAGARPENLSITLAPDDRTLRISGTRGEPHDERRERIRCYQLEIYYGEFERDIPLPGGISFDREGISANYRNGILVISLPKREKAPVETRSIEITNE